MNLLEYCKNVCAKLETLKGADYVRCFVDSKMECFHLYHNNIITGSFHGINFFENVIKYWDDPESFYIETKENKNVSKDKNNYEYNFVRLIQQNKK